MKHVSWCDSFVDAADDALDCAETLCWADCPDAEDLVVTVRPRGLGSWACVVSEAPQSGEVKIGINVYKGV